MPSCRKTIVGATSGPGPCQVNSMRRPPANIVVIDPPPLVARRAAVHMVYNTNEREIVSGALCRPQGNFVLREIDGEDEEVFPIFIAIRALRPLRRSGSPGCLSLIHISEPT